MKANEVSQILVNEMTRVVVGQSELCHMMAVCLIAGGHMIIEGAPGLGKTLAARTMAKVVAAPFKRVQFTPDLMPSDIIGTNVYDASTGRFVLRQGPLFTSFLLADEINRTPPKTQSALLEAMEESRVTIDGTSYVLPQPFMVLATQNPIEYEGTYPLPEAQLDRFMVKLTVGYPEHQEAKRLLDNVQNGFNAQLLDEVKPLLTPQDVMAARTEVNEIHVEGTLFDYILHILEATRRDSAVYLGASPRAGIAMLQAGKAMAVMEGRSFCVPEDFKSIAKHALCHRLLLTPDAEIEGITPERVLDKVLSAVPVPQ
ncbi:MAG: MoxR family ATPase [Clostridiales bacterium]|nr:MoxR family ATPase [Clostridiales bacterium]